MYEMRSISKICLFSIIDREITDSAELAIFRHIPCLFLQFYQDCEGCRKIIFRCMFRSLENFGPMDFLDPHSFPRKEIQTAKSYSERKVWICCMRQHFYLFMEKKKKKFIVIVQWKGTLPWWNKRSWCHNPAHAVFFFPLRARFDCEGSPCKSPCSPSSLIRSIVISLSLVLLSSLPAYLLGRDSETCH